MLYLGTVIQGYEMMSLWGPLLVDIRVSSYEFTALSIFLYSVIIIRIGLY